MPAIPDRFRRGPALILGPAGLLFAASAYFFAIRNIHGWTFLQFGDEAGHLLGALAMHAGDVLYRDYIDAHGPVIFLLTQLYGALTGWHDLTYARTVSTILATLAVLSVGCSPVHRRMVTRLWSMALLLGALASVWLLQALYMDSYHTVAGAFVTIGLALFVVPAWHGRIASPLGSFIAGACFALLGFTAYSYAPAAVLLAVSGGLTMLSSPRPGESGLGRKRAFGGLLLGVLAGAAVVLGWLAIFGDIIGFIVFHIIINQVDYAPYIGFGYQGFLASFHPPLNPATLVQWMGVVSFYLALVIGVATCLRFRRRPRLSMMSIAIGFAGLALLNARGSTLFQDGTFLMACFAALAMAAADLLDRVRLTTTPIRSCAGTAIIAAWIAGMELIGRQAVATPPPYTRAQLIAAEPFHYGEQHNPLFDKIRRLVPPDKRILVLVYDPIFFLSANRLPMKKYHEYLPWEADYAKAPWFGRQGDLCEDLRTSPPRVVYFDDWNVWGAFPPEKFMPCVIAILADKYVRQTDFPDLYVRKDLVAP